MARVKVCGECWKPLAECICDDDPGPRVPAGDDGTDGEAA